MVFERFRHRQFLYWGAALILASHSALSFGWVLSINSGSKSVFLQVGNGSRNKNVATVNLVSLTIPANQVGNAQPLQMSSNSTQANSPNDGFHVCVPPTQVYLGGYYRRPNNSTSATIQVTSPASLNDGTGDSLPFTEISWSSTALENPAADIPAGSFNGSQQILYTLSANYWVENCLTFFYANSAVRGAGTYTGRVTYTLTTP